MNPNTKKVILIFGGALLLYFAFTKIMPIGSKSKKLKKSDSKSFTEDEKKKASVVLTAYKQAQKAGESKSFLEEMNVEFAKDYGFKVYTDKGAGSLFVADLEGNKVI